MTRLLLWIRSHKSSAAGLLLVEAGCRGGREAALHCVGTGDCMHDD